ncbi:PIG-L family deacetylase [Foetidibacter luteolus]|uniref:PIG-L family deacetylase n=1 Tax=Foetidibacter luteolus TaxID=2608880 RepID=UPI00129B710A|nr:PIG-L family deacetylase [Foetidibacter luteolus]
MKKCFLPAIILLLHSFAHAQIQPSYSSADIYQQLKKLKVMGSVLYIAAHPDDENTRLLAYLAKEKQYRTGYLSLTRGDGGQNLIGDEQGIELGLIRTQELLAARRIDGAEQFFSRAYDFGFSKSADEALAIWGHDKILSDVVWVIRKFQPDVIITRFPGDERAGHGHHWASALLANEAFKVAADSTRFPGQFKYGVQPWQAKRILWNTYNFGSTNTTSSDQFKIDVGEYNAIQGKSYGEIASESRSQHKSQGFGVPRQRGQAFEYFVTTGGEAPTANLMDGVETTWLRLNNADTSAKNTSQLYRDLRNWSASQKEAAVKVSLVNRQSGQNLQYEAVERKIDNIIATYNFTHPENSVDSLVDLYQSVNILFARGILGQKKLQEIEQLILACAGIFAEATSNSEYAVPGDSLNVQFFVNKRNNAGINLESIRLNAFDTTVNWALAVNQNAAFSRKIEVLSSKEFSQPYWLEKAMQQGSFETDDQLKIGEPESHAAYTATFIFNANGKKLFIRRPVMYKYTDPVKGELYEPVVVIAPVTVALSPNVILSNIQPGNERTGKPAVKVEYKSNITAAAVNVQVQLSQPTYAAVTKDRQAGSATSSPLYVKDTVVDFVAGKTFSSVIALADIFKGQVNGTDKNLQATVTVGLRGKKLQYRHYLRTIQFDHIPHISYFYRDNVKVITEEIKTAGNRIGYIAGAGDKVPQSLVQMGYEVKLLTEPEITEANLRQFDAVLTGVRAYNIHEWLSNRNDVLMAYVQNGGNLIVQYNTNSNVGPMKAKIGHYNFNIGRTRVTEESAKVHVLLPNHPVLNHPNKIAEKDFDGWIQERSIYHADQLDSHFETPLAMKDSGEKEESNGSLIIAPYGKGNFVYTGLVFFRELPAGVSGAYRLMANLIALPQHKTNQQ